MMGNIVTACVWSFALSDFSINSGVVADTWSSTVPSDYTGAWEACERMNMKMASIKVMEELRMTTKDEEIHKLWLPFLKQTLPVWSTLSGTEYNSSILNPKARNEDEECTFIRLKDGLLDEIRCNQDKLNYSCLYNTSTPCPSGASCISFPDDLSLSFLPGGGTWYDGLKQCQLLNIIKYSRRKLKHYYYAVGIVQSRWMDTNTNTFIKSFNWAKGEPDPSYSCAVVILGRTTSHWEAADCNQTFHFICFSTNKDNNLPPKNAVNLTRCSQASVLDSSLPPVITIVLAVVVAAVSSLAAVFIWLYIKNKQKVTGSQSKSPEEEPNKAGTPLLNDKTNPKQEEADDSTPDAEITEEKNDIIINNKNKGIKEDLKTDDLPRGTITENKELIQSMKKKRNPRYMKH